MEGAAFLVLDGKRLAENPDLGNAAAESADLPDKFPFPAAELVDPRHDTLRGAAADYQFDHIVSGEIVDADQRLSLPVEEQVSIDADLASGDGSLPGSAADGEVQSPGRAEEIAVQTDDESLRVHIPIGAHLSGGPETKQ